MRVQSSPVRILYESLTLTYNSFRLSTNSLQKCCIVVAVSKWGSNGFCFLGHPFEPRMAFALLQPNLFIPINTVSQIFSVERRFWQYIGNRKICTESNNRNNEMIPMNYFQICLLDVLSFSKSAAKSFQDKNLRRIMHSCRLFRPAANAFGLLMNWNSKDL